MPIKVVTDSTCDLLPSLAKEMGIEVVPLYVFFGGTCYRERVDLSNEDFRRLVKESPHFPRTSQPTPEDFLNIFKRWREEGFSILSIHLSSKLSGTVNSAERAKAMLSDEEITVVDSLSASLGLGNIVLRAAEMARAGETMDAILAEVRRIIPLSRVIFAVNDLEHLRRGGRIGKAKALLGSLFNIKPILHLIEGEIHPKDKTRGMPEAVSKMLAILKKSSMENQPAGITIGGPPGSEEKEKLVRLTRKLFPEARVADAEMGAVICAHTGTETIGLMWYL